MTIQIEDLSIDTLKQAIKLARKVFGKDEEDPKSELIASVDSNAFRKYRSKVDNDVITLRYFVETDHAKVVGLIGLYELDSDHFDSLWIGWFAVDTAIRKRGIGKLLLNHAIGEAKRRNKVYLKLYTSTDKSEQAAQFLYEKYGFTLLT